MTDLTIEHLYLTAGIALLLAAVLPRLFRDRVITAPMLMLGAGAVGGLVIGPTGYGRCHHCRIPAYSSTSRRCA
ncbi:hypothetical protein ACWDOP_00510 [Nocardia sp. NPDC003693]